jgi:site-specific DNA recombinase
MNSSRSVVAYCRVSTLEQKRHGFGIDIQIRDVSLLAERQGLFVERFYKDEGQSGAAEHRRALGRLLRDCRHGKVGAVILPSLDRLSRNVRIAENLFHEFEKLGVRILIADMPTYDSRDRKDVMLRQIREVIAEENRRDIIERLLKGRQERVRRGLPPGGNVAYGYRRDGNRITSDTLEAQAVRVIFELSDDGVGRSLIASALNERGITRRNGRPWTQRQVAAIVLRRALYMQGVVRYGDVEGANESLILLKGDETTAREAKIEIE